MPLNRDKALPELPIGVSIKASEDAVTSPLPSSGSASNYNKTLPTINIEMTLSEEEMDRLHDVWNETSPVSR